MPPVTGSLSKPYPMQPNPQTRTALVAAAALFVAIALPGHARSPLYEDAGKGSRVSASYVQNASADFDSPVAGDTAGQRTDINGLWDLGDPGGFSIGYSHQYDSLDIDLDSDDTLSNSHHHSIALPLHWHSELSDGDVMTLSLAPAISVSSNVLKEPDLIDKDAVQLWGSALYRLEGDRFDWLLGINHDYRFGEGNVYPVVGGEWSTETATIRVTYPDIMANWRFTERWSLDATVAPDGNLWRVWDRDREIDSDFRREAWRAEFGLNYDLPRGWRIGLTAGYSWDVEWKFTTERAGVLRNGSENQAFFGASVSWSPGSLYFFGSSTSRKRIVTA